MGILDEGDDTHLCFAFGALQRVYLVYAFYARGPVFGCVGDDIILDGEFLQRERSSFDVASDELLTFFVVEWVAKLDTESGVIL